MTIAARVLNTAGLVLTIIGCLLLFLFGLPADVDPKGRGYLILQQTDETEIARGRRYLWFGRVGISLVGTGALFQIVATWVG